MATQIFLEFSPRSLEKMNPFWRAYFSNGLKPATSLAFFPMNSITTLLSMLLIHLVMANHQPLWVWFTRKNREFVSPLWLLESWVGWGRSKSLCLRLCLSGSTGFSPSNVSKSFFFFFSELQGLNSIGDGKLNPIIGFSLYLFSGILLKVEWPATVCRKDPGMTMWLLWSWWMNLLWVDYPIVVCAWVFGEAFYLSRYQFSLCVGWDGMKQLKHL